MRKLLWVLAALACAAFSQAATGSISGTVLDPQHQAVPGAKVTVTSTSLTVARTVMADASGKYLAAQLPPGGYSLTAVAPGLRMRRPQAVTLGVGGSIQANLAVELAQSGQEVSVSASGPTVEGQTVAPAADVDSARVANVVAGLTVTYLPNRDRDFTEFGALAAGAQTSRQGLEVDGQRAAATQVEVDGSDFSDPLEGGVRGGRDGGFFFPQTVVQEFSLDHAGVNADVGGTNGGFLNVATKEGSNRLHGEQFYIIRPAAWTGRDAFGHSLSDTQNEFGASIGGALIKDKLFFYVGGEQDFVHVPYYTAFQPQAAGGPAIPASLAALQGQTVGHNDPTALSLRLDYLLDASNTLNLEGTYNRVQYSDVNPGSTQVWTSASNGDSLAGQSDWIHADLSSTLGPATNQLLAQWAGDRRDLMPNVFSPEIVINGFGTLGGDGLGPHRFVSNQRGISDDLAWSWHGHLFHFGGSFAHDPATEFQQANLEGRYDFNSLADFIADAPRRYQQTFAAAPGSLQYQGSVERGGYYIYDRIPLQENLTLTAGLRWDGQWNPQPVRPNPAIPGTSAISNDLGQWQPRAGLAWNPKHDTVVRISGGLYDAPTPATYFQRVLTDNGLNAVVADSAYDPQVLALATGNPGLSSVPAGLATPAALVASIAPGFRNPRSFQAAASLQQKLNRRVDVTTGYSHNSSWDLERVVDANLSSPTLEPSGMPVFPQTRPLPAVGQLLRTESTAHSTYDGWLTSADFQLPYSLGLAANYTLARTRDDASAQGPFGVVSALNPFNLAADAADSNQDVRHNFNISGTDRLPLGFKINPIFIVHSGEPYTPIIGFDTQNDGNDLNDRAILNGQVAGRNSFRQPAMYGLDLRFVKDFTLPGRGHHLDLFLDVFNLTNHGNKMFGPEGLSWYGTAASPVFSAGLPLFAASTNGMGGPRQIQFTARLVGF